MSIRDLTEQFTIQGAFQIKKWDDENDTYIILAEGDDFEYESCGIEEAILNMEIKYMYVPQALKCIVFEVE